MHSMARLNRTGARLMKKYGTETNAISTICVTVRVFSLINSCGLIIT